MSFDKSQYLYGLYECVEEVALDRLPVYIVEGAFDVMALSNYGLPAVAVLGSSMSAYQMHLLKRYTDSIVLWFDNDDAGERVSAEVVELADEYNIECARVKSKRPYKDPGEAWQEEGFAGIARCISGLKR